MRVASPSDLTGKRVLVTGASGFTGRYVTAELKAHGCRVIGVGGQSPPAPDAETPDEFNVVDLRDQAAVDRMVGEVAADHVVHLAAVAFVGHGNVDDFYRVNLLGTRNLLQALAAAGHRPERVLLASSANVYGNLSSGALDESMPPAPANDYAVSKLAMEHMAHLWSDRLPLTITRPFNYTGVGQAENFLVPKIVAHFARRAPQIELGNLEVSRDFGDVRAVALAYRQLLQSADAAGKTVNVCTGIGHSLGDILAMCSALSGHSLEVRVNPAFVRANEVRELLGDNRLLRRLVCDWDVPPLEETLRWMLTAAERG
ncbi:NAD-dependent epimerase/dehydratase family protein [Luteimonas abyssi]|uniref:NAD-dependent epimerase/dehydratase family protein n=1 Tax=Luteimonas abyssi TaxID=1247514 RepID=UPI00192E3DDA|nr:NAD-dependent epimerase/dehydratase family protein [Luteimonas abyssi]